MNNKYLILSYFIIALLYLSCSKEDNTPILPEPGLLKKIEGFSNDQAIDDITEISYDASKRVTSVSFSQGSFSLSKYDVTFNGNEISTLTITNGFPNSGTQTVEAYTVDYQNDQIILTADSGEKKYILSTGGEYINSYRYYYDLVNEYYQEALFIRDSNNNIDTISYFATNLSNTSLMVSQFTFSNFTGSTNLNDAFNPVFYYSHSLYNPFIGFVLGLKLSNETPLNASFFPTNGVLIEDNIIAQILEVNGFALLKYGYLIHDLPSNNYHLEFEYE